MCCFFCVCRHTRSMPVEPCQVQILQVTQLARCWLSLAPLLAQRLVSKQMVFLRLVVPMLTPLAGYSQCAERRAFGSLLAASLGVANPRIPLKQAAADHLSSEMDAIQRGWQKIFCGQLKHQRAWRSNRIQGLALRTIHQRRV